MQDAAAVEATVAQQVWRDGFGEIAGLVAGCFARRETRQMFRETTEAMLMGVVRANCWTLAEALGHGGPHRLQHFLARAVWDHDAVRDRALYLTRDWAADDERRELTGVPDELASGQAPAGRHDAGTRPRGRHAGPPGGGRRGPWRA
jgi:hypothetical protein